MKYVTRLLILGALLVSIVACTSPSDEGLPSEFSPTATPSTDSTAPEPPITIVGVYSDVKSNGEHQRGYTVMIWRQGERHFGLIYGDSTSRAVGDGPRARIEDAEFDRGTNRFRFSARMDRATCGSFEFVGRLSDRRLEGRLYYPSATDCRETKISLPISEEETAETEALKFANFAQWVAFADRIVHDVEEEP